MKTKLNETLKLTLSLSIVAGVCFMFYGFGKIPSVIKDDYKAVCNEELIIIKSDHYYGDKSSLRKKTQNVYTHDNYENKKITKEAINSEDPILK